MAACFSFFYMLLLMAVPVAWVNWKVYRATAAKHYRQAGNLMKFVMIAGIAYCGVLLFL
jgi:hypothetical protein